MSWPISKSRLFSSCIVLILSLPVGALEESRLWLAKSHQKLYLPLVKAAKTAEAIERCEEVLEGTLDVSQSKATHPIYRILCRQKSGRSYNEMVDGISFETLTTPKIIEVPLTPEEEERLRQKEEERERAALKKRKKHLWQMCEASILGRTKMMVDFEWKDTQSKPEPTSIDDESALYEVDFNAKSIWGKALHYQAQCSVTDQMVTDLQLRKR